MGKSKLVVLKTRRLTLPDSEWIDIKEKLTYAETQALSPGQFQTVQVMADGGREFRIHQREFAVERIMTYVDDWSLLDDNDHPLPLTKENVERLDPDFAKTIDEALTTFIEEVDKQAKNGTTPAVKTDSTSEPDSETP